MEKKLTKTDLTNLAHGSCFFACGGGGSLSAGLNMLNKFEGTTTLISKEEAVADKKAYTLVVAYIGAPEAVKNLDRPTAAINAFNLMNKAIDGEIKYVVPVEQGAISTLVSCVVANELNLKVIDGDGAGRAVPQLNMLTYASKLPMKDNTFANSGNVVPSAVLASKDNQCIEITVDSPLAVEAIARPFVSAGIPGFDQAAGLGIWLMDSEMLDKALTITGTIDLAIKLGDTINNRLGEKPYQTVVDFLNRNGLGAKLLFSGEMMEPEKTTSGGFDMDKIIIKDKQNDVNMHIYSQNESLVAWVTDTSHPLVMAPDSICFLSEDGQVFSNADIENETEPDKGFVGKQVGVIAILSRKELINDKQIMLGFKEVLTNLGYPCFYKPFNQ
jgi:DUF917 family protein